MRIKSYFAPSVQSAISIARKEFGDDVTLVTSHTAPLESRHLGDYEVVFAVDETPLLVPEPKKSTMQVLKAVAPVAVETATRAVVEPVPVVPEPAQFQNLLQEAIATPLSTEENLPEKLERVHSILLEMGIDGPMVRALMTMIERSVSAQIATPVAALAEAPSEIIASEPATAEAEIVEPEPAALLVPDLTPAELAFYLSVSVGS